MREQFIQQDKIYSHLENGLRWWRLCEGTWNATKVTIVCKDLLSACDFCDQAISHGAGESGSLEPSQVMTNYSERLFGENFIFFNAFYFPFCLNSSSNSSWSDFLSVCENISGLETNALTLSRKSRSLSVSHYSFEEAGKL